MAGMQVASPATEVVHDDAVRGGQRRRLRSAPAASCPARRIPQRPLSSFHREPHSDQYNSSACDLDLKEPKVQDQCLPFSCCLLEAVRTRQLTLACSTPPPVLPPTPGLLLSSGGGSGGLDMSGGVDDATLAEWFTVRAGASTAGAAPSLACSTPTAWP